MIKIKRSFLKESFLKETEEGMASVVTCLFFLSIVIILMSFALHYRTVSLAKAQLDDGLTSSTLAALVYDAETYARYGYSVVDEERSYNAFMETLKTNLGLDNGLNADNPIYYKKVTVKKFVIYNVTENDIEKTEYSESGVCFKENYANGLGEVYSENRVQVTTSSIYAELEISLKGFMGSKDENVTVNNYISLDSR